MKEADTIPWASIAVRGSDGHTGHHLQVLSPYVTDGALMTFSTFGSIFSYTDQDDGSQNLINT